MNNQISKNIKKAEKMISDILDLLYVMDEKSAYKNIALLLEVIEEIIKDVKVDKLQQQILSTIENLIFFMGINDNVMIGDIIKYELKNDLLAIKC
jgi:hypothetical protein